MYVQTTKLIICLLVKPGLITFTQHLLKSDFLPGTLQTDGDGSLGIGAKIQP